MNEYLKNTDIYRDSNDYLRVKTYSFNFTIDFVKLVFCKIMTQHYKRTTIDLF